MRASSRPSRLIPLAVLPLVLVACGSDDGTTTSARTAAQAPTSTTAAPTSTGASDQRDPKARLAAISAAMSKVRSFHFEGTATDEDGDQELSGDTTDDGRANIVLRQKGTTASVRVIGDAAFIRGDEAFWRDQAPEAASKIADRWVRIPVAASGLDQELRRLEPKTIARCVGSDTGDLRDGGTDTLDGRKVDVLVGEGGKPGTAPGRAYTAADGPALLLRVVQTGKTLPGGTKDPVCDDADDEPDTTTRSDVRLSRFDAPVRITPPADAITIPTGQPGTGQSTS